MNDTKTVSGAIVHVTDADEAPLVRCLVDITPKQSGTGTPSPDNVRPISGWESVKTGVMGKNFFPRIDSGTKNGITATVNSDGSVTLVGTATASASFYKTFTLKAGTYIITDGRPNADAVTYLNGVSGSASENARLTIPNDVETQAVVLVYNGRTVNQTLYPMLRLASDTDPTYEPYTGTTTTKSLGRTVYGGTLDVVNGVLTAYPFYPSYNGETLNGRWICDRAVYAEGTTPPTGSQVALISGTGTTYTLTPTQINTLLGENNVWADSGDVEITYHTDTLGIYNKIYINGRPYFRPNDFEIKREDVYAGEYTTCTGKLIADKIGWKYSDLPMKWDILPDDDLVYLTTLTGAFDILFRDSDGQHTEQVIRRAFTNTPTRTTGPEGTKIWTGVEMEVSFLNTHPINE